MDARAQLIRLALTACLAAGSAACSRDPHATALPTGEAGLARVQAQLDQLPPKEQELVVAYLRRSKGTVLPARLADPDAPFTARTFGEAIRLQRDFEVRQAAENAKVAELRAAREAALEPLRRALSVELVNREILTEDQVRGRQPTRGVALRNTPILVTTYRLRNRSAETMTRVSGTITVRTKLDPASPKGLQGCYFEHTSPIPAGEAALVRCGDLNKRAGEADEVFVQMPESSLVVAWDPASPQAIAFAGGAAPSLAAAPDKTWAELRREATHLYLQRDLDGAVALEKRALALAERDSPEDPRIAKSLRAIATVYRLTGRAAEAVPLYKRAIAILEREPDSTDFAICLRDLASTYEELGRPRDAEPLTRRLSALEGKEGVGPTAGSPAR